MIIDWKHLDPAGFGGIVRYHGTVVDVLAQQHFERRSK